MDKKLIYGIQQIGVGVDNARTAFEWYATRLGADVSVFEDDNVATYMAPYMGGVPHKKKAILAMNMQGGSGYEIWQYTDRIPQKPEQPVQVGDLGINITKIKSRNIERSYERLKKQDVKVISDIKTEPCGKRCFYIQDPCDNILQIKESDSWYSESKIDVGGVYGCSIGVTDVDAALRLYSDILGYDKVIYDLTDTFEDLQLLPGGKQRFRRILLSHQDVRIGGFSKLFGESQIELIQALDTKPRKIFQDRYWGDIGFIHLCFDIRNMADLVKECKEKGFPFRVLSDPSFDMGDASGHWGYIEDPDGTLIEFVETHKVPLIKKLNWNINMKNRHPEKPLPDWLIKAMSLKRVKFSEKVKV
jgi:catechol 2,3-dioxygenase-like lactoylglutathione lyase family enzyme